MKALKPRDMIHKAQAETTSVSTCEAQHGSSVTF
jgi:hypothetical protein